MNTNEKKEKQREATRRWRKRNPDKVKEANRRKRIRKYEPLKRKKWREIKLTNTPEYREKINKQMNDRATKVRRWLDNYKMEKGCIDCGYKNHHAALHFDHVRGTKKMNVCNSTSISGALNEIKKCVVRCANCHAEKTFKFYPCKPDIFAMTYEAVER